MNYYSILFDFWRKKEAAGIAPLPLQIVTFVKDGVAIPTKPA
jgi:hypothetical protein